MRLNDVLEADPNEAIRNCNMNSLASFSGDAMISMMQSLLTGMNTYNEKSVEKIEEKAKKIDAPVEKEWTGPASRLTVDGDKPKVKADKYSGKVGVRKLQVD